jgi:hypothetical protein
MPVYAWKSGLLMRLLQASIGRAPPVNFEVRREGQASAGLSLSKKLNPGLTSVALCVQTTRRAHRASTAQQLRTACMRVRV